MSAGAHRDLGTAIEHRNAVAGDPAVLDEEVRELLCPVVLTARPGDDCGVAEDLAVEQARLQTR
jgi:hypothetical protein